MIMLRYSRAIEADNEPKHPGTGFRQKIRAVDGSKSKQFSTSFEPAVHWTAASPTARIF